MTMMRFLFCVAVLLGVQVGEAKAKVRTVTLLGKVYQFQIPESYAYRNRLTKPETDMVQFWSGDGSALIFTAGKLARLNPCNKETNATIVSDLTAVCTVRDGMTLVEIDKAGACGTNCDIYIAAMFFGKEADLEMVKMLEGDLANQ